MKNIKCNLQNNKFIGLDANLDNYEQKSFYLADFKLHGKLQFTESQSVT